jgi:hypothetical protein
MAVVLNDPLPSSEISYTPSLVSPSKGFGRLLSLLNTQQKGFAQLSSSVPKNIVPDKEMQGNLGDEDNLPDQSVVSVKTTASLRAGRTSAKARFEKAQPKLRRLAQRKELERKLEEFHLTAEMEDAEIELKVLDEQENDEEKLPNESLRLPLQDRQEMVNKYIESIDEHLKVEHEHDDNPTVDDHNELDRQEIVSNGNQNADVNVTSTPANVTIKTQTPRRTQERMNDLRFRTLKAEHCCPMP